MSEPRLNEADEKVYQVEESISTVLRVGVTVSLIIVVIGMAVTMLRSGEGDDLAHWIGEKATFPHTPYEVWAGLRMGDGQAIVVLGLMVLLATPFFRVAVSAIGFARARDWAFVLITLIVLTLLATSLWIGAEHG